jgi:ABC-type branched-subunit amino acid transport system substrate-binding protein
LQAVGGATLAGVAGCTGGGGGEGTFTIGGNLPLSEGWEPYGNTQIQAAEIAVAELNDNGGLDGQEVEFVVENNQVDPQTTRDMASRLVEQENADIILGPISSANRIAMASEVSRLQVPALYASQYEGDVAEDYCNEGMYQLGDVPLQKINPFIPYLMEEHGESFYLLGDDYVWPQEINGVVREVVDSEGGEIVGEEYVSLDTTDFTSIIPRIEQADPDILFMTVTGAGPAAIQDQMHEQDVRDQFTQVGLAHGQGVIQGASSEASEGVLTCHMYFENIDNEANNEFVQKLKDKHGEDILINYFTGPAYNAIQLLADAVKQGGGTSTEELHDGLDGATANSVMGETTIEVDQQMTVGTSVGVLNSEQKYDVIESFDPVTPEEQCDDI